MRISDCTVREARRIVKRWHRHLPDIQGGLFAAKLVDDAGAVVGCALAGNGPRVWQGTGRLVISRVAVVEGTRNGCSMLYGALVRAARALGWREVWTYTLPEEPGTSLKAAGFQDMGLTDGWGRTQSRQSAAEASRQARPEAPLAHRAPGGCLGAHLRSAPRRAVGGLVGWLVLGVAVAVVREVFSRQQEERRHAQN